MYKMGVQLLILYGRATLKLWDYAIKGAIKIHCAYYRPTQ